jgi:drug/metabolite transporter (DMT)-like permease
MQVPHDDHLVKGVINALSAAIMLTTMNMVAKLMSVVHDPVEITFYRNLVAIILLLAGLAILGKLYLLKTKRPWAQFIRSAVGTTGMIFCIWTISLMPLTTATAFIFTAPLFVTLLSYPLLKERVGLIRFVAVLFGFSGVLLITQPEGGVTGYPILIGLCAGFLNGLVAICLRWLGNTENTATTNFYFFLYGLIGTAVAMPFIHDTPTTQTSIYIVAIGIVGLLSLLFKTQGYRLGPAAFISPISYTMLIWALLFDYFIWQDIPSLPVIAGALIIISSNIFIIWRENRRTNPA